MRRIIQVGLGAMGQGWADCVARSGCWEASAYVDISRRQLTAAAEKHGMPKNRCFRDINIALQSVEADAVLDVTPQQARHDICISAMEHGVDVLCEKPLADTPANAVSLATHAQQLRRTLMVAQNYRYQPVAQTARRFIAQGRLGAVGYVGVTFHKGPRFGGYREKMAYPLLLDMSIHHVDMMRYILGMDVEAVQGVSVAAPWNWNKGDAAVAAQFEMTGGVVGNYFASWVSRGWETDWNANWRIEGEKGVLLIEDSHVYFSNKCATRRKVALLKMAKTHQEWLIQEFARCLDKGLEPETSSRNNLNSLVATHAAVRAVREQRRVRVNELLEA